MKKCSFILAVAMLLNVLPVFALAQSSDAAENLSRQYVPEDAVYLSRETDDGKLELKFWSNQSREFYEVELDAVDNRVLKVSSEALNDRGGSSAALGEEQISSIILANYPEAVIDSVALKKDDGAYEYRVSFRTRDFLARFSLHSETGVVLERKMDYEGARRLAATENGGYQGMAETAAAENLLSEQSARQAVLSRIENGVITKLQLDWEDGRRVYEGKAITDTHEYEFEMDAMTGAILDWDMDRLERYDRDDD